MNDLTQIKLIRRWIALFIACLFLSGLTAIPIDWQLSLVLKFVSNATSLHEWLSKVLDAYREVNEKYPFLIYGYDWLAFAHFVLAILFIGPYKDPVKNIWVIQFGLIACLLILPTAFIAGHFRNIPLGWRLIDCSFGVIGFVLLAMVYKKILHLENTYNNQHHVN
jgi:hypothetical protein